ncbi:putative transcriptional regulator, TetR family (tetracyclin resistance) [Clostridia bacterium]|nr:putative transcriptional regulator, TetR family (tetracyclin resistance) [Clostridia bacterium]
MRFSKDMVVSAAINILNRDGSDGLTMRAVAAELGTQAATIYNHVTNKDELYSAIADHISETYDAPPVFSGARDFLIAGAKATRKMLLTVRDATVVFENSMPTTPTRMRIISAQMAAYRELGVPDALMMVFPNMVNNYITAFVADECRAKQFTQEDFAAFSRSVGITETDAPLWANDFDKAFEMGLELLFAGLDTLISRTTQT